MDREDFIRNRLIECKIFRQFREVKRSDGRLLRQERLESDVMSRAVRNLRGVSQRESAALFVSLGGPPVVWECDCLDSACGYDRPEILARNTGSTFCTVFQTISRLTVM